MSLLATADARAALIVAGICAAAMALSGIIGASLLTLIVLVVIFILGAMMPVGVLAAAVVTLPYFYSPIDVVGQQFAASELLLVASAIGTAIRAFGLTEFSSCRRSGTFWVQLAVTLRSPLVVASVALVILGGILVAFPYAVEHRAESLREWRWTLAEPALLVGLLVWNRRVPWLPDLVATALIAGGSVASLHALADFAVGGGVAVGGVTRIAGPYPHPNALALMTIRIAVLGSIWAVFEPRVRRIIGPLTIISVVAVAATFSRGAMLAALVAFAIALVNAPQRIRMIGMSGVGATLLLAVIVARDRMLDLFGGGSGSLRIDIWSSALQMIDDRPVRGYGPDQFLYAYLPRYVTPTAWAERFTSHAHNFLLDFWIRLGIIGAAFVGFVVLLCLLSMARRVRSLDQPERLGFAALVALTATIAHGLVDNAYFSHDLAMSCWLLAWLAFGTRSEDATAEGEADVARAGIGWSGLYRLPFVRQSPR